MLTPKQASKLRKEVQKARDANLPVVFLGGLCEDSNAWRKEIKEEFSDRLYFLDPYDKDWDPADNIYDELAGMLTADYVVFYKGGKGSKHEQIFLDMVSEDAYAKFDDLEELKAYLERISARVVEAFLQRSAVPHVGDPPQDLFLELMSHNDAVRILRDLKLGKEIYIPALGGYPDRKISRRDLTNSDWVNLHTYGYTKGNKNPPLAYENGHYVELTPAGILRTAGYDRDLIKPGYRGRFVINDHDADKAGRHWDLRLEMPVTSLAKALGHYEGKRTEETPEPGDTFPDEPGTVYRSFAVKKHHAPTEKAKVFIVETEDHPISYGKFHGTIPDGEYGAGDVAIWDRGTYEIKDVEGDSKYVLKFHGKKLSGTYALVKYEKGYLWVKSKDEKKASVIDYVRPTLPVQIWDLKSLRLKPSVRAEILERLVSAYEEAGLHNPLKWITELTISGSAAAYNYTDGGDLDIDISYDLNLFRGQNPGLAGLPQAAVLKLVRKAIGAKNDAPVNGSSFVYSFMVLEEGDDPSGDGLYDVFADQWLKIPVRPPLEFDPDKAFRPQRAAALTVCRMVDDIIRMILATVADLKKLDEKQRLGGDAGRRVILMAELKALCSAIYSMHKQIWALQRDSKNPAVPHRYPAFDLSPNWDERMVIFKYIVRYGCHLPIHKLYELIEDDPYFDTIDRFIHWGIMPSIQIEVPMDPQNTDTTAMDSKDIQAARDKEIKLLEKGSWLQKNVAPLLALLAVLATMSLFFLLVFVKIDATSQNIVLYILGVLSTILSQIFAYYFGSSAGSKAKQEQLFKQNGK